MSIMVNQHVGHDIRSNMQVYTVRTANLVVSSVIPGYFSPSISLILLCNIAGDGVK